MKNKRNITIKVIENNNISNRKLAEYFARKYEKESQNIQSQKYQKS